MNRRIWAGSVLVFGLALGATRAADWPQWRGPRRNGVSAETAWQPKWGPAGPKKLWSAQLGQGFSSVAVVGGRLYTMGSAGERDTVFCLDASTGKPVWRRSYPCPSGDYGGPRATPTVSAGRVYTLSREGLALCLDAAAGRPVWSVDLKRETGSDAPRWGFAGSPLVQGNMVVYNVGSAGVALDKTTGKVIWKSAPGTAGYASAVPYAVRNQQGLAFFTARGLAAVNPANGRRLWEYAWETNFDVNAADPVFTFDRVFISSDYGKGCALLRLTGSRPEVVWQNRNMKNHVNMCVLLAGSLYGNDENTLKCIDLHTGAEKWRSRGIGKGGLIAANGYLIVLTERGELLVIQATPRAYTEVSRAKVMGGTCWTHPVLANGRIYCRSHEGELVCVDVRK